ncbi:MAG: carboxymuconolactone decarboxylase family protein [Actinobacteria bacterium]|nr:carboxymuconolactone decarboxylase family protein [Actinomycetota bacterium]
MWIESIAPAHATGELKDLYERIGGARGGVAQIHLAQSLNPRVLAAHFELYKALMFQPSPLSRADREALAVVVSRANACAYCAAHHGAALSQLGEQSSLPQEVLEWAARLARAPETASEADIAALRAAGLTDRAILDAVLTVAYFSYANRLVLGLGLETEPGFESTCRPHLNNSI